MHPDHRCWESVLGLSLCWVFAAGGESQASGDMLQPGDLLHVEVYENPDLTIDVRVPSAGAVQFPLVGPIDQLRNSTSDDLARQLKTLLEAKFLKRAMVSVVVREYGPRQVYVMGGVARPGAISLDPAMSATAVRAISEAGGLVEDADRHHIVLMRQDGLGGSITLPVFVVEPGVPATIPGSASVPAVSTASSQPARPGSKVAAPALQHGDVVLRPNDLIMVSRLERVYLTGQVRHPGSIPCNQANLTVARALSLVGGFEKYAKASQVQLLRAGQLVRVVDVEAILAGRSEDPLLIPGDMINVPERRY